MQRIEFLIVEFMIYCESKKVVLPLKMITSLIVRLKDGEKTLLSLSQATCFGEKVEIYPE